MTVILEYILLTALLEYLDLLQIQVAEKGSRPCFTVTSTEGLQQHVLQP